MSTALFETSASIAGRRSELQILIDAAEREKEGSDLHKAVCRSASVLLASHLEGFLKDASRSIMLDLNYNLKNFSDFPAALQRTFCHRIAFYEGVPTKDVDNRARQLIAFFQKNNSPIDLEAFSYKETTNKNPSGSVIDAMFAKFGVQNIIGSLAGSRLEVVFDDDKRTNYLIIRKLRRHRVSLFHFPYISRSAIFGLREPRGGGGDTIWHSFVNEVMVRRHSIVHGDTLDNLSSTANLSKDIAKLDVLMHGILLSLASYLARIYSQN